MVAAYLIMGIFKTSPVAVAAGMALSGIGWASVCALPFAMLSRYIKPGTEGSVMGIFNIFFSDCLGERDDNHRSLQIEPAG